MENTDALAPAATEALDLQLGDHGPAVREIHDFLTRYGYFPSDELAKNYPGFEARVLERPADPDVFDDVTERGVRAYQRFMRLPESGIADAATLAKMHAPRCGEPDVVRGDGEKWSVMRVHWGSTGNPCVLSVRSDGRVQVTYSIDTTDAATWSGRNIRFTQAQYKTAIQQALLIWMQKSSIGPTEVTSNACVRFRVPQSLSGGTLGDTSPAPRTDNGFSEIRINSNTLFGLNPPIANNAYDLVETLAHEFGHAILLNHSNVRDLTNTDPLMLPDQFLGASHRVAEADDLISEHVSLHRTVQQVSSVTVADAAPDGSIWYLDNSFRNRGYSIHNNIGGSWHVLNDGSEAVSIAVDGSGVVWTSNTDGEVWRRTAPGEGGSWTQLSVPVPMLALAAGGSATAPVVWALSRLITRGQLDHDVYRFNPSSNDWTQITGAFARALAVDRSGRMFHVNEAGQMWASTPQGGWVQINLSGSDPLWSEIHAGKDNTGAVFALDRNGHGYVWNVQVFFSGGAGMSGSDVPGEKRWAPWDQNGTYSTLFSDKNAQVWSVVGNALSMAR